MVPRAQPMETQLFALAYLVSLARSARQVCTRLAAHLLPHDHFLVALSCGIKQPFTISACPLDTPLVVNMDCTSAVTWTYTWTALSGPLGYDIGPLNSFLATQQGSSVACAKN